MDKDIDDTHRELREAAARFLKAMECSDLDAAGHADRGQVTKHVRDRLPCLFVPGRIFIADVVAVVVAVLQDFLERLEHHLRPHHLPGAGDDVVPVLLDVFDEHREFAKIGQDCRSCN
jgi:hypothetical protein